MFKKIMFYNQSEETYFNHQKEILNSIFYPLYLFVSLYQPVIQSFKSTF